MPVSLTLLDIPFLCSNDSYETFHICIPITQVRHPLSVVQWLQWDSPCLCCNDFVRHSMSVFQWCKWNLTHLCSIEPSQICYVCLLMILEGLHIIFVFEWLHWVILCLWSNDSVIHHKSVFHWIHSDILCLCSSCCHWQTGAPPTSYISRQEAGGARHRAAVQVAIQGRFTETLQIPKPCKVICGFIKVIVASRCQVLFIVWISARGSEVTVYYVDISSA